MLLKSLPKKKFYGYSSPTGKAAVAAAFGIPLAHDYAAGTQNNNTSSNSYTTPTFTTSGPNEIVVVTIISHNATTTSVTATGLTFARPTGFSSYTAGGNFIDVWYAKASSVFSGTISIVQAGGTGGFMTVNVFAVIGVDQTTPWDAHVPTTSDGSVDSAPVTTTGTNTFAFGVGVNPGFTPPLPPGWNAIAATNYNLNIYKIRYASAFAGEAWNIDGALPAASFALKGSTSGGAIGIHIDDAAADGVSANSSAANMALPGLYPRLKPIALWWLRYRVREPLFRR